MRRLGFAVQVPDREGLICAAPEKVTPLRLVSGDRQRGLGPALSAIPGLGPISGGNRREVMTTADPNRIILTGENPFIRLSAKDGDPNSTDASFWRIITCPRGPGHVLYVKSELTEGKWRVYTANLAMARWLQSTVQGMPHADL